MATTESVPGWNDNCTYATSKDPAPPKSRLQGDSGTPYLRPLIEDSNHTTSRGGNTTAPGGRVMGPRAQPKGTSGRAVGSGVS